MNLNLTKKRVLITGASRGIGLAIAEAFLREHARVVLVARTPIPLREAADRLSDVHGRDNVLSISADCADESKWSDTLDEVRCSWGGLDVVVANVGDGRSAPDVIPDTSHFAKVWKTNFTTSEMTARATLPLLLDSKGSLLFVSSIAGLEAIGAPTDYSVAKTAVASLSKQMARKLAPHVRVNCLAPGNVFFPGGSWDVKIQADAKRIKSMIEATVPMKRFGRVEEIGDAVVFLCSNRASFITGACLVVDGGQTVRIS